MTDLPKLDRDQLGADIELAKFLSDWMICPNNPDKSDIMQALKISQQDKSLLSTEKRAECKRLYQKISKKPSIMADNNRDEAKVAINDGVDDTTGIIGLEILYDDPLIDDKVLCKHAFQTFRKLRKIWRNIYPDDFLVIEKRYQLLLCQLQ